MTTRLIRPFALLLVLASVACFSVFGCGGGGIVEEGAAPTTEEEAGEPLEGDDPVEAEEDR